jgi:elongation factor G
MKALIWRDESLGAEWDEVDIPADLQDKAAEWREKMIETAVEMDEAVMESYLEGEEPDQETLKRLIRKGTCNVEFFPVLCGSAFKNKGVQPLLDAVVDFLPSPVDIPAIKGIDVKTEKAFVQERPVMNEPFPCLLLKL